MFNSVVIALVFNGLDILSGFIAAIKERRVHSSKLRDPLDDNHAGDTCDLGSMLVEKHAYHYASHIFKD